MKVGAWTYCPKCSYVPANQGKDIEIKSVLLSDHYMSAEELQEASKEIQEGREPKINRELYEEFQRVGLGKDTIIPKMPLGCIVLGYAPFVILAILIILIVLHWLKVF
jgi:hypothetical protein